MCRGGHVYGGSGCVSVCGGAGVCMGVYVAGCVWGVCVGRVCVHGGVCVWWCVCEMVCVCLAACIYEVVYVCEGFV